MPFADTFLEIAAMLSLATVLGVLGQKLRQPLIIMFLAAGILAGPAALGIIQSYEQIDLLAHIGIALLLFIVGLKLDLNLIQISEFSLIIAALGLSIGHITAETMGLITLVGVATIFASTYLILYSGPLYERLAGQTLAEAHFRQKHGVTVVGIRRDKEKITTPAPTEQLVRGDCLIVIGNKQAVEALNQSQAL